MTGYAALLRAVNVGGRKLIMDDLKAIAVDLGFANVRTYIASGNLLFSSDLGEGEVKAKLEARLAERSQVLVVTHSPQVAARASHHYRIEKSHGGDGTRTSVRKLSVEERREEIARMLAGAEITAEARAAAERLLRAAMV